jgi:phage N-6-adenine-methyltransferase
VGMHLSSEDAEEWTQALGQSSEGLWRQVALAIKAGAPQALGLTLAEWGDRLSRVRLSPGERAEAAAELRDEGLSQREIGAALGVDQATVHRDLSRPPDANASPEPAEPESEPEIGLAGSEFDWNEPEDESKPDANASPEPPRPPAAHVGRNSGDNEWYTPAEYIKAATAVMGAIDLDPASTEAANVIIGAARFYTEYDDGLSQPWAGRVWLNPPYAQPYVDRFCTRVAREIVAGNVIEACVLVNNGTETNWFQEVAAQASAICFPRGRVKFWHPSKEATPLQGQAVLYLGPNAVAFRSEFFRFGFVVMR